ncbi:MAG: inositol monophosphatase [Fibrobacteria bacterium]|nr:inositol monophosphatase [Fibrobacteria bacterium]
MIQTAIEAARRAGEVLRSGYGTTFLREEKGRTTDLVTEFDRKAEDILVESIRSRHPDHRIIGEEGGDSGGNSEWEWILDPLDGTTSFAHGIPFFSVCVALRHRGEIVLGVVYEPLRDELFAAERGAGATLDGAPIRVSPTKELSRALLATGFPYAIAENPHRTLEVFTAVVPHARGIRRLGSAGLDLAYVACGRFDGYWEHSLKPWDCAAGALLVREAGGVVTTWGTDSDAPWNVDSLETLATNGAIHQELSSRIREGFRSR